MFVGYRRRSHLPHHATQEHHRAQAREGEGEMITQPHWEFFGNLPDSATFDHEGVRLRKCAIVEAELS